MESLSSPRLRASAGDFFAVPCSPVAGGMRSFPNSSFQFSSAISVRNSGLRACLKSRSRGKKVHFLNCQTWHFPGHWKPRHLGYKAETDRVNVHDLHHVPSARGGSPTTDPPPPRTQRSPHRCGLRCAPKNPGLTAEGYERGFVAARQTPPFSKSWRRKNHAVLECARQSAASTPLWSCPKRQTHSLPSRIPISSSASREEPRNPQRGHLRTLNEWQCASLPLAGYEPMAAVRRTPR
jgi:hypothetical protein